MSIQLNALPASAGAEIVADSAVASRLTKIYKAISLKIGDLIRLHRQLSEIQGLSDRELLDIGLADGEIHRLRKGDVFSPMAWSAPEQRRR